jgi:hypothetical protein
MPAQTGLSTRQSNGVCDESGLERRANAKNPPWIKALADVRHRGTREGYCFQHVQAIMLAIDQIRRNCPG